MPTNFSPIATGAEAMATTVNMPLTELDNAIVAAQGNIVTINTALTAMYIGPNIFGGSVFYKPVGAYGMSRADAQIEIRNQTLPNTHALLAIFQMQNPGRAANVAGAEEGALSFQAYDSAGGIKQQGSISYMWVSPNSVTGYCVLRLAANKDGGTIEPVQLRLFGGNGVVFFGPDDMTSLNYDGILVYRTTGMPSICGEITQGLVLDGATVMSAATPVYLNAYNAGPAYLCLGGGAPVLPTHTTTTRNALTAITGMVIWNSTTTKFEGYNGATWDTLSN